MSGMRRCRSRRSRRHARARAVGSGADARAVTPRPTRDPNARKWVAISVPAMKELPTGPLRCAAHNAQVRLRVYAVRAGFLSHVLAVSRPIVAAGAGSIGGAGWGWVGGCRWALSPFGHVDATACRAASVHAQIVEVPARPHAVVILAIVTHGVGSGSGTVGGHSEPDARQAARALASQNRLRAASVVGEAGAEIRSPDVAALVAIQELYTVPAVDLL